MYTNRCVQCSTVKSQHVQRFSLVFSPYTAQEHTGCIWQEDMVFMCLCVCVSVYGELYNSAY